MTRDFDPYYEWLAIPPAEQPPDYYRLLQVQRFEQDRDVIQSAADRQMAHVHSFQSGSRGEYSRPLLNEIARTRAALTDPARNNATRLTCPAIKLPVVRGSRRAAIGPAFLFQSP